MTCVTRIPGPPEADSHGGSLPKEELLGAHAQRALNRQVAALCLQAATMTDNAVERELLRRRAAQLISTGPGDRRQRLAY